MTGLPVISADERLKETRGIKGVLLGTSGIGKTSQLWTLPPESTLFMDLEAGDLAIEGWSGDTIRPRTWAECRDFAVFIGGANPALRDDQAYSRAHFEAVCQRFGDPNAAPRNLIATAITLAHKDYAALMGTGAAAAVVPGASASPPWAAAAPAASEAAGDANKPFWAR